MSENNKDYNFLCENLLKFRKGKGLSQEELGNEIGVSRQTIYKWESGECKPDMNNIFAMCKVLDKDINEFVDGVENFISKDNNTTSNEKSLKNRNLKKVFLVLLLIIIVFIVIIGLYRFIIIHKINNNVSEYSSLNNYHYVRTSYKMQDEIISNEIIVDVYFKDGIYKEIIKEDSIETGIVWINYNDNEGYTIDLIDNNISSLNLDEDLAFGKDDGIYNLREGITECDNIFIEISLAFSPIVKIQNTSSYYVIQYTQNGQRNYVTKVWINKETGLPENKISESEDKYIYDNTEYEIGNVKDKDVEKINIENYSSK